MKKLLNYILIFGILTMACSDDENDPQTVLGTPSLLWSGSDLFNDQLLITVEITSHENLPTGKLMFQSDNYTYGTYLPLKGKVKLLTSFSFQDTDTHEAALYYMFNDNRDPVSSKSTLTKLQVVELESTSQDDWTNY
jgi:hypothetical protein